MVLVTIYHNPNCSKSLQTLALLRDHGVEPEVIEYLKTPPDALTLAGILSKLRMEPRETMRTKEEKYMSLGLAEIYDREKLIQVMVENPILIERPIVVRGNKACIGRPPDQVLKLLKEGQKFVIKT